MSYIIAIDQGTTGTTALLVNAQSFELVGKINHEFPQIYPKPGLVEHCLSEIWATVEGTITELMSKFNIDPQTIVALGITNQRETTCAFNSQGQPLANAIVWQDRRTHDFCQKLKDDQKEEELKQKTGLPIDPYFSATKMRWLLKNNDSVKQALEQDDLKFGTIDTFLLYKLTSGESFATDASNASRTLLYNLETGEFDNDLLELFEVPSKTLPEIKDSIGLFGKTKSLTFLPDGIPITGILGDQQSALFGQAGVRSGDIKCTYGTGAFLLLNTGDEIFRSSTGLLSTVAYRKDGKDYFALEGSTYIAGAAVQWLRDNLNFFPSSPEIEKLALEVHDLSEMEHLLFLPFFTGIGSPYWNSQAKAAIIGLTRDTHKAHIARACLDGIALSINDLIMAMEKDTSSKLKNLKVDGGAVSNSLLMELQSYISGLEIVRPKVIETTGYGACLAAAIGSDLLDFDQIQNYWQEDTRTNAQDETVLHFYQQKKEQWTKAISKIY